MEKTLKATYRERIQALIYALGDAYDEAGTLRDYARDDEKAPFNELRGILYSAGNGLQRLDNALSVGRANMRTSGKGLVKI